MCRSTLRRILFLGLDDIVHFGAKVTGYRSNPDSTVTALLEDGGTAGTDVLIAADGINSAVRAQRLPQVRVADLGARSIAAKIPLTAETKAKLPSQLYNAFSMAYDSDSTGLTLAPWSAPTRTHLWSPSRTPSSGRKPGKTMRSASSTRRWSTCSPTPTCSAPDRTS